MRCNGIWGALAGVGIVVAGSGCPQGPGGGNGNGVDGPDAPGEAVAGFFEADESWAIRSDGFVVVGVGNFVEIMMVSDQAGENNCIIPEPDAVVDFEDGELAIETDRETDGLGVSCAIDASMGGANCAPDQSGDAISQCTLVADADGLEFEGETLSTQVPTLVRFDECIGSIPPLEQIENWNMVSVHPIAIVFTSDPRAIGGATIGEGSGSEPGAFLVATSFGGGAEAEGCFDGAPAGSVTLEDGVLEVEIQLEDGENGTSCSVEFSGSLTYCTMLDPSALGGAGGVVQLLRFDGTGRMDTGDNSQSLPTLYFGYMPDNE